MKADQTSEEVSTDFQNFDDATKEPVTSFEQLAAFAKAKKRDATVEILPYTSLDGFTFELAGIEFQHVWESYPDPNTGRTRRRETDQLAYSDDGERCKARIQFILTDERGHSTSRKAPFTTYKEVSLVDGQKLVQGIGEEVELINPRVVFVDTGEKDSQYGKITTVMRFDYDGFKF